MDVRKFFFTVILFNVDLRQIFIRNLKYYRNEKKLRQLDLAIEIGKSSNYINSIENGKYFPSPETIAQIADYLEIDPMKLFDKNNPSINEEKIIDRNNLQKIQNQLKKEILTNIELAFEKIQDKNTSEDSK